MVVERVADSVACRNIKGMCRYDYSIKYQSES